MSTNTLTSTLTKKYPRSILMNKNREQPRMVAANEAGLVQAGGLLDESLPPNPTVSYATHAFMDYQQPAANPLPPANYPPLLSVPILNPTSSSNQPIIYESQLTFNPATGQHEQQLITCDQYYGRLTGEPAKQYTGCLSSLVSHDFQLSISCWRRRLLILILVVNAVMAIVNAAIIVWIISYYYLSFVSSNRVFASLTFENASAGHQCTL